MKLRPLIWKEAHETLIYLWIGLFVFLGLPIIGGFEAMLVRAHRFELWTSPWVVSCGGVLAVFVAVGSTCRDLVPRLMDFWQSRPVTPWVWMAVKYVVGLVVVELACILPVLAEALVTRNGDSKPALLYLPFLWFAVYSFAFLIGCLVRRTAQAAMISLVAMVLLWLLPTIFFWLRPFDVTRVMRVDDIRWEEVRFALSMSALAIILAITAVLVAQFNLQIRANRRVMLGTIAGAGLLLLGSLGFRFGTNMPVLQTIDLRPQEFVQSVYVGPDNVGFLYTMHWLDKSSYRNGYFRKLTVTDAGITVGPPVEASESDAVPPQQTLSRLDRQTVEADANHWYSVDVEDVSKIEPRPDDADEYLAMQGRDHSSQTLVKIWRHPINSGTSLFRYQNKLFALGHAEFVEYDISDIRSPKELGRGAVRLPDSRFLTEQRETLVLPALPGVPARERLDCMLGFYTWYLISEGDLVVARTNTGFVAYRLTNLNDQTATFVQTARHEASMMENVFGAYNSFYAQLRNGLLYTGPWPGINYTSVNPRCTVYDVNDGLKEVGHFAAAGAGPVFPLADGRSIVAGMRVYLVGPPPKR